MAILPLAPRGVRQRQQVGSIADNCPSDLPPALPRAFVAPKGSVQSLGRLVEWVIGGGGSAGAAIGNAAMASTTADYRAEPMAALLIVPRRIPGPRSHRRRTRIQKFPEEPRTVTLPTVAECKVEDAVHFLVCSAFRARRSVSVHHTVAGGLYVEFLAQSLPGLVGGNGVGSVRR